jgi:hypothetical protein
MANAKIPDLTAATSVADTDLLELCNPGVLSQKVTALQLKNYSFPVALSMADGFAYETFDDYSLGAISSFNKGYGFVNNGVGTGCTIISSTQASGQVEQRLKVIAGQYGRKMPWGNDWGRIQLCWLWRVNRGSTFTSNLAYFGVCSGTTNMAGNTNTDNFTGIRTPSDASACVFSVGTRVNLITINPAIRYMTRRGAPATDTDRTSGSGSAGGCISASAGYLSGHFLEISRPAFVGAGSVTYNFGRRQTDAARVEDSLPKTALTSMLDSDIVTGLGSGNTVGIILAGSPNTNSYAFDESTGELDTINLTWPEAFEMEFAAIGVRKVY